MDKMREEFESWFWNYNHEGCDKGYWPVVFAIGCDGKYQGIACEGAWQGWKASRSALCVELNSVVFSRDKNGEGGLMLPERVFKAMDDAGVKYK